jgi:hypothetical protein
VQNGHRQASRLSILIGFISANRKGAEVKAGLKLLQI